MSLLLLLFIFALWLAPVGGHYTPQLSVPACLAMLFGGYALLVLVVRTWAVVLSRGVDAITLSRSLRRFNLIRSFARAMIPGWLAFATFCGLGWRRLVLDFWVAMHERLGLPSVVQGHTPADYEFFYQLPGLLVGIAPPLLAWIGLWWAQFPADRALREQNLLSQLDHDLPVHSPPTLGQYMVNNLRQQVLFTLLPVGLILLIHDVLMGMMSLYQRITHHAIPADLGDFVMLPAAGIVFLFAPELLRRVLSTVPLPASPLRDRLEGICRRSGLRYREILLWRTQNTTGNAAVMGLIPRVRYIILSDLLLETMDDQQIEAVFAHEVGHIVHRHILWYLVFFVSLSLWAMAPTDWLLGLAAAHPAARWAFEIGSVVGMFAAIIVIFGYLSRHFERQADVFAARMIESNWNQSATKQPAPLTIDGSFVGERGAGVFASALRRVAVINNIPLAAWSWCHGSLARRMRCLHEMSADPGLTARFDRLMSRVYIVLVATLLAGGGWVAAQWVNAPEARAASAPTAPPVAAVPASPAPTACRD